MDILFVVIFVFTLVLWTFFYFIYFQYYGCNLSIVLTEAHCMYFVLFKEIQWKSLTFKTWLHDLLGLHLGKVANRSISITTSFPKLAESPSSSDSSLLHLRISFLFVFPLSCLLSLSSLPLSESLAQPTGRRRTADSLDTDVMTRCGLGHKAGNWFSSYLLSLFLLHVSPLFAAALPPVFYLFSPRLCHLPPGGVG